MSTKEPRKKKARISSAFLAKIEAQSRVRAGTLHQLAWKQSPGQITQGEVKNAYLEGIGVDFRHGRDQGKLPPYSFVTIADATGLCSIGAHTANSGLDKFKLPSEKLSDDSLCFFEAKISGNFSWYPNRKDGTKPVIIAKGTFQKLAGYDSPMSKFNALCCPTFDVLDQISTNEYAETSRFTTSTILGEVTSVAIISTSNMVTLCLEDLVGVAVVQISSITDGNLYVKENNLVSGKSFVIEGPLRISEVTVRSETYPCLSVGQEHVKLSQVTDEKVKNYEKNLKEEEHSSFLGVVPKNV